MALFREFFSSKKKVSQSRDFARDNEVTQEQVRLLLFKETDWRGRKILFDSSTIEKIPADKDARSFTKLPGKSDAPCIVEVSDGFAYKYNGAAPDTETLGEMMFGAVALNSSGVSFKIHILTNPYRLMCTKVFTVPARCRPEQGSDAVLSMSHDTSASAMYQPQESCSFSFAFERGDSGYYESQSPGSGSSISSSREYSTMFDDWGRRNFTDDSFNFNTPPCGRKLSSCSNGSWQRRMLKNMSSRFDNLLSVPSFASNRTTNDSQSQVGSASDSSATCSSVGSAGSGRKKTRLGLALLITLADVDQLQLLRQYAEHSPQLENMFCRLRMLVMLGGVRRDSKPELIATLSRAAAKPVEWLADLLNGPRVPPMWLNLVQSPLHTRHKMAETLLTDLCAVLRQGDTKHTKFFISTLLTHVLTFHLGWVSTVSPYEIQEDSTATFKRSPYNALWAQLNDLCGSIGCPPRSARTIITGKRDKNFIEKLLSVLTYFMRCGDISRTIYNSDDFSYGPLKCYNVTSLPIKQAVEENSKVTNNCDMKRMNTRTYLSVLNEDNSNSTKSDSETLVLPKVLSISVNPSEQMLKDVSSKNPSTFSCLKRTSSVLPVVKMDLSERISSATMSSSTCLKRTASVLPVVKPDVNNEHPDGLCDTEFENVVFVLGDDDKLVGLKNKSSEVKNTEKLSESSKENTHVTESEKTIETRDTFSVRNAESPSRCCNQQSQHSKSIKHSGFKFEFDKYPQIVTNYMKSKNLEILDRHYIGKPGNLKLDNFQFDPTVIPPIQEDRCDTCFECQMMESSLQTPTNASELWSDVSDGDPTQSMLQYAKETIVGEGETVSPKTFVRKRKKNTVVINLPDPITMGIGDPLVRKRLDAKPEKEDVVKEPRVKHLRVVDVGMPSELRPQLERDSRIGYQYTLFGGLTDHYVPDMILQGTVAPPAEWEHDLRRDLDLTTHINKQRNTAIQTAAIIADCDQWSVRVVCNGGGGSVGGMSALVGAMLDALPHMRQARLPAHQCLSFVESKLRELCVLSKSLADLLMSTDLCDMATLTQSLSIDANDVPLLLAVASTHTPHIARKVGISYR